MTSFAFGSLRTAHFLAIMVNTGWEVRAGQQQQQQQQQQHLTKQEPPLRAGCGGDCGVPAWRVGSCSMGQDQVVARLARLPIQQLCPRGFVMLWADKEHLAGTTLRHNYNTLPDCAQTDAFMGVHSSSSAQIRSGPP
jgi:hypothetical protein